MSWGLFIVMLRLVLWFLGSVNLCPDFLHESGRGMRAEC
ncbi:hypothetical protein FMEAI12_5360006 [Parafrankia sp. Ea1.12]|nr:hypothetical protein FMEAI12_5360006 [Parafrankia sp. Ea1.12]